MPLAIPDQPRRFYDTNPLKLAVCQVRVPLLHRIEDPAFLAEFHGQIQADFPRSGREQQLNMVVGPGGVAQTTPNQIWRFRSGEDAASVAVAPDFVSLEVTSYERFERFLEMLTQVVEAFTTLGITYRERLGVRYVDEFRHPEATTPAAWRAFINPELLGMVGGELLGDDVIHALEDIRLEEENGILAIRHGYVSQKAVEAGPHYLLDLDYYDEAGREFNAEQTLEQVTAYHQAIHNVFEISLTDAMRAHLGVREETNG